jgi:hypothetical protein
MTYEDIVHEYRKLFIMLVEKAGRETGNTRYLRVEETLKEKNVKKLEQGLIEREPEFVIIVCSYLVLLFCDIYGIDGVEEWDQEESATKLSEFYQEFLKKATIKFCEKYGLEPFDDPETSFKLIAIGRNEKGSNN